MDLTLFFDPDPKTEQVEDGLGYRTPGFSLVGNAHRLKRAYKKRTAGVTRYDGSAAYIAQVLHNPDLPFQTWVGDGVSGIYYPGRPPYLTSDGFSGGEMTQLLLEQSFQSSRLDGPICQPIAETNRRILNWHREHKIDLDRLEERAGTCLAACQYDPACQMIKLAQIGDTLAFWKLRSCQQPFMTRNQVGAVDRIGRQLKEQGCTTVQFYEEHIGPVRYTHANNSSNSDGYGFLNGQEEAYDFLFYSVIPTVDLEWLALVTDGVLPELLTQTSSELASWLYETCQHPDGAKHLLRSIRTKHDSHAEATGVIINFA